MQVMTLNKWVTWYRTEQDRLNLKRPSVDRIDSNGHYEISNMSLIELGGNSRKAYCKGQEDLLTKYETLKVKYEKLLKKVGQ